MPTYKSFAEAGEGDTTVGITSINSDYVRTLLEIQGKHRGSRLTTGEMFDAFKIALREHKNNGAKNAYNLG